MAIYTEPLPPSGKLPDADYPHQQNCPLLGLGLKSLGLKPNLRKNCGLRRPSRALERHPAIEVAVESQSGASFVNNIERRFRSPPEPTEPGRGYHLPDARFARLRA
jgi:hypothetical protein